MTTLMTSAGKRERRSGSDYEIESVTKALQVLEALEGIAFEPVTMGTIVGRTGLGRDFVFRALKTLEMRGYAVEEKGRWTVGRRIARLGQQIVRHKL